MGVDRVRGCVAVDAVNRSRLKPISVLGAGWALVPLVRKGLPIRVEGVSADI